MKTINNYKNRFFNLLESEMGNVKPLITESVDEVKSLVNRVLVDKLDMEKVTESENEGNISTQYEKEIGDTKISVLVMMDNTDGPLKDMIGMKIFKSTNGGSDENITSELTGGDSSYVTILKNEFEKDATPLISKALGVDNIGGGEDDNQIGAKIDLDYFKDLLDNFGFSKSTEIQPGVYQFSKKLRDEKAFVVYIFDKGEFYSFIPVVFDIEAKKDPSLFGVEIPPVVGTLNIERGLPFTSEPESMNIKSDKLDLSKSDIMTLIKKGFEAAEKYRGKHILQRGWEDSDKLS